MNRYWRNVKNGLVYEVVLPEVLDVTNNMAHDPFMVAYRLEKDGPVYVRNKKEFLAKFEEIPTA